MGSNPTPGIAAAEPSQSAPPPLDTVPAGCGAQAQNRGRPRGVRRLRAAAGLVLLAALAAFVLARVLSGERDPNYAADECTAWAYDRRPDLTRGTRGLPAAEWEGWARENGFRVDTLPRAGDVAVWDRNIDAGTEGHVAYVERVMPDGAVFVTERNIDGCSDVTFVRLTPGRLSTALFIHE